MIDWTNNELKIRWKIRQGCGSHNFNDERGSVKAGQTFTATAYEMRHIQFKIEALDPLPAEEPEIEQRFEVARTSGGRYNVINAATGKPLNDTPLLKAEAYEMAGIEEETVPTALVKRVRKQKDKDK